jgi:hypothetical protein
MKEKDSHKDQNTSKRETWFWQGKKFEVDVITTDQCDVIAAVNPDDRSRVMDWVIHGYLNIPRKDENIKREKGLSGDELWKQIQKEGDKDKRSYDRFRERYNSHLGYCRSYQCGDNGPQLRYRQKRDEVYCPSCGWNNDPYRYLNGD